MAGKSFLTVDDDGQITKLSIILKYSDLAGYQVAGLCGFPPPRLSEYALGRRAIPMHHLIALSEVLGMEPEDIVGTMPYDDYVEQFEDDAIEKE